jgi:hypothetical protein
MPTAGEAVTPSPVGTTVASISLMNSMGVVDSPEFKNRCHVGVVARADRQSSAGVENEILKVAQKV